MTGIAIFTAVDMGRCLTRRDYAVVTIYTRLAGYIRVIEYCYP